MRERYEVVIEVHRPTDLPVLPDSCLMPKGGKVTTHNACIETGENTVKCLLCEKELRLGPNV